MGKERESGVEALKILAMALIVISHVVQTLGWENAMPPDALVLFQYAPQGARNMILSYLRTLGAQGNLIFFVCSAWFLTDSRSVNLKKVMFLAVDVWTVNWIILAAFFAGGGVCFDEVSVVQRFPDNVSV